MPPKAPVLKQEENAVGMTAHCQNPEHNLNFLNSWNTVNHDPALPLRKDITDW